MPTDHLSTDSAPIQVASMSSVEAAQQHSHTDMDTDSDSDSTSLPRITGQTEEGELSDSDQDLILTDADQALSDRQNCRETMHRIRFYMDCSHIPDVDSAMSNAEDNPFVAPKQQQDLARSVSTYPKMIGCSAKWINLT